MEYSILCVLIHSSNNTQQRVYFQTNHNGRKWSDVRVYLITCVRTLLTLNWTKSKQTHEKVMTSDYIFNAHTYEIRSIAGGILYYALSYQIDHRLYFLLNFCASIECLIWNIDNYKQSIHSHPVFFHVQLYLFLIMNAGHQIVPCNEGKAALVTSL